MLILLQSTSVEVIWMPLSFVKGLFDKCFTIELHIMEQKPLNLKNTPAPPDQEEEKEQPQASRLAAVLESISLSPCWLIYMLNLA